MCSDNHYWTGIHSNSITLNFCKAEQKSTFVENWLFLKALNIYVTFHQIEILISCLYWSAAKIFYGSFALEFDRICHRHLSLWPNEDSYELQVVSLCDCIFIGVHWAPLITMFHSKWLGQKIFLFCDWFNYSIWHTRVGDDGEDGWYVSILVSDQCK